jgi:hypothetical protein
MGEVSMSDTYIIEVRSEPAGLVVRDGGRFTFFAANSTFASLDGRIFRNPRQAEQAAIREMDLRAAKSSASRQMRPAT